MRDIWRTSIHLFLQCLPQNGDTERPKKLVDPMNCEKLSYMCYICSKGKWFSDEWLDTESYNLYIVFIRSIRKIQNSWELKPNASDSWNWMENYNSQNSTGYKTNYLLLWRYPAKLISVLNRSAKQVSRSGSKTLQVGDVQRKIKKKRVLTFVSYFAFLKNVSF